MGNIQGLPGYITPFLANHKEDNVKLKHETTRTESATTESENGIESPFCQMQNKRGVRYEGGAYLMNPMDDSHVGILREDEAATAFIYIGNKISALESVAIQFRSTVISMINNMRQYREFGWKNYTENLASMNAFVIKYSSLLQNELLKTVADQKNTLRPRIRNVISDALLQRGIPMRDAKSQTVIDKAIEEYYQMRLKTIDTLSGTIQSDIKLASNKLRRALATECYHNLHQAVEDEINLAFDTYRGILELDNSRKYDISNSEVSSLLDKRDNFAHRLREYSSQLSNLVRVGLCSPKFINEVIKFYDEDIRRLREIEQDHELLPETGRAQYLSQVDIKCRKIMNAKQLAVQQKDRMHQIQDICAEMIPVIVEINNTDRQIHALCLSEADRNKTTKNDDNIMNDTMVKAVEALNRIKNIIDPYVAFANHYNERGLPKDTNIENMKLLLCYIPNNTIMADNPMEIFKDKVCHMIELLNNNDNPETPEEKRWKTQFETVINTCIKDIGCM